MAVDWFGIIPGYFPAIGGPKISQMDISRNIVFGDFQNFVQFFRARGRERVRKHKKPMMSARANHVTVILPAQIKAIILV